MPAQQQHEEKLQAGEREMRNQNVRWEDARRECSQFEDARDRHLRRAELQPPEPIRLASARLRRGERPADVFGPEEIRIMRKALDKSWAALAFARWNDDLDARRTRESLALAILRETARGERNIGVLTDNALGSLEPRSA